MVLALLAACGPGGDVPPPTGGVGPGLSVVGVVQGQALTGSLAVAALGVGGPALGVSFELAGTVAAPDERGIAILNTRAVSDGPAALRVSATVAGRQVVERLDVVIANGLPSAATLGPAGGALRSGAGSVVLVPPGALGGPVPVSVRDSSQQEILDEFGIDYPALGVTFLGAVGVENGAERFRAPVGLDMAGWAQAMQPGQEAVMFAVLPDASGNGVGELTFAANAMPTPDGSVVSLPTVRSEVYGRNSGGDVAPLQSLTARPGEIVTLQGRGFNPAGIASNVARFASGPDLLVAPSVLDDAAFGPLMEVRWAVPALGSGTHGVTLHNLTTGYATEPFDLGVGALASGSAASFGALVGQVRLAVEALTVGRPDLAAAAVAWLEALEVSSSATAWGMAAGSGLVSASHRAALDAMTAAAVTTAQRALVLDHALLLDAVAHSVPSIGAAAADLATLLVALLPPGSVTGSGVAALQSGDGSCVGSSPTAWDFFIGQTPTGMGSAGGSACSGGSGITDRPVGTQALQLGEGQGRLGRLGPVRGAFVAVFRQGTFERLSPFTSVTDAAGYFYLPFVPPNEPFTVRAVDPATGAVAEADGMSAGLNVLTPVQLVFGAPRAGGLSAAFTVTPWTPPGTFRFDNAPFNDPQQAIAVRAWDVGTGLPPIVTDGASLEFTFLRGGEYTVSLSILDASSQEAASSQRAVDVVLADPYVAGRPTRIVESSFGGPSYAISGDGRYIAFHSSAPDLVPSDTNGRSDVFLYDRTTGAIERVSLDADGGEVDGFDFQEPAISADGRYVAYTQRLSILGLGDQVVVRDRSTGALQTFLPQGGLPSVRQPALSADGRTLVFQSTQSGGSLPDSLLHAADLDTGALTWVSEGFVPGRAAGSPSVSADGRRVAFAALDLDGSGQRTGDGIFVRDLDTGVTVRASESAAGVASVAGHRRPAISADGRLVAFDSSATDLVDGDLNGEWDVFLKDLVTGAVELLSSNAAGVQAQEDSYGPSISGDGRWVAFGSYAFEFFPLDSVSCVTQCNPAFSTRGFSFVKDRATGWVALLTIGLGDELPNEGDQTDPRISADGRTVVFRSRSTNLVPESTEIEFVTYWVENPLWRPVDE
jgi:Tol biopolymer transport system component